MIAGIIGGPTGVGKSEFAYRLAVKNGFEIVCVDSRQVYKGIPIGTSCPERVWQEKIPHHFCEFLGWDESYSLKEYQKGVMELLEKETEKKFLLVGGTGLYLQALMFPASLEREKVSDSVILQVQKLLEELGAEGMHKELHHLDPKVADKIHPNDIYRTTKGMENFLMTGKSYAEFKMDLTKREIFKEVPIISLTSERSLLYERINQRTEKMLEQGWLNEVQQMLDQDKTMGLPAFNTLGYTELAEVLNKRTSIKEAVTVIQRKTRNYAKRQITFFKNKFPEAIQINVEDKETVNRFIESF